MKRHFVKDNAVAVLLENDFHEPMISLINALTRQFYKISDDMLTQYDIHCRIIIKEVLKLFKKFI